MKKVHLITVFFLCIVLMFSCKKEEDEDIKLGNIKIGFLHNFSGTTDRSRINSILLAIDEINAAGGVHGRQLELKFDDTKSDTTIIKQLAQDFINDSVVAILGLNSSTQAIVMANNVTIPNKIVYLSYLATSPSLTTLVDANTVWRAIPSDAFQGNVAAKYAKDSLNCTTANILYIDNTYGNGLATTFKTKFEALGGTVANFISVPSTVTDFSAYMNTIFSSNKQLLYLVTESEQAANFTNNAQTFLTNNPSYTKPIILGCDGNFSIDKFLPTADINFSKGFRGLSPTTKIDNPNYISFIANFTAKYGAAPTASYSSHAYDAVYLLAYAMQKADENIIKKGTHFEIAAAIAQNLRTISGGDGVSGTTINVNEFSKAVTTLATTNINYEGASGSIDFDENGDIKSGYYSIWEVILNANILAYKTRTYIQYP